jgi:hypothetical protein
MIMKYKDLGTMLSKEEMKKVAGGYKYCETECGGIVCGICRWWTCVNGECVNTHEQA